MQEIHKIYSLLSWKVFSWEKVSICMKTRGEVFLTSKLPVSRFHAKNFSIAAQFQIRAYKIEGTQWRQGVNTSERKCSHKKAPANVQ